MQKKGVMFPLLDGILQSIIEIDEKRSSLDDVLDNPHLIMAEMRRTASHWLFSFFRYRICVEEYIRKFANNGRIKKNLFRFAAASVVHCAFQNHVAREKMVNVFVEYAKIKYGFSEGRFINALLRKVCRENPEFKAVLPEWCSRHWRKIFGSEFVKTAEKCLGCEPVDVFRLRQGFEIDGFEYEILPCDLQKFTFFQTSEIDKCIESGCFQHGGIYIQDAATGFAVELLDKYLPQKQGSFIDVCGAPGGKSIMFHDLRPDWQITVGDLSCKRHKRTAENLQRCKINAVLECFDASTFEFKKQYDAVFADVPCSNSGVFRKRPDVLYRFDEKSLHEVVEIQKKILDNIASAVADNGFLLYSTCSIEPAEDGGQIRNFCLRHIEFELLEERLTLPDVMHDGSYCAVLRRNAK